MVWRKRKNGRPFCAVPAAASRSQGRSRSAESPQLMTALTRLFRSLLTWGVDPAPPAGDKPTNAAGASMPTFAEAERAPVPLERVEHPDGRVSQYPPPEVWDDWTEYDGRAWPRRVSRNYSLVPTICFNCESACGLLAYVDKTTFEIKKFEGNPVHPGSRGRNCAKGPATHNQTYDPERIVEMVIGLCWV